MYIIDKNGNEWFKAEDNGRPARLRYIHKDNGTVDMLFEICQDEERQMVIQSWIYSDISFTGLKQDGEEVLNNIVFDKIVDF